MPRSFFTSYHPKASDSMGLLMFQLDRSTLYVWLQQLESLGYSCIVTMEESNLWTVQSSAAQAFVMWSTVDDVSADILVFQKKSAQFPTQNNRKLAGAIECSLAASGAVAIATGAGAWTGPGGSQAIWIYPPNKPPIWNLHFTIDGLTTTDDVVDALRPIKPLPGIVTFESTRKLSGPLEGRLTQGPCVGPCGVATHQFIALELRRRCALAPDLFTAISTMVANIDGECVFERITTQRRRT